MQFNYTMYTWLVLGESFDGRHSTRTSCDVRIPAGKRNWTELLRHSHRKHLINRSSKHLPLRIRRTLIAYTCVSEGNSSRKQYKDSARKEVRRFQFSTVSSSSVRRFLDARGQRGSWMPSHFFLKKYLYFPKFPTTCFPIYENSVLGA